jgi:hypothetical protein
VLIAAPSTDGGGKDGERAVRACESRTVRRAAPLPPSSIPKAEDPECRRSFDAPADRWRQRSETDTAAVQAVGEGV